MIELLATSASQQRSLNHEDGLNAPASPASALQHTLSRLSQLTSLSLAYVKAQVTTAQMVE